MMTFDVEVLLKGTNDVVAETVTYDGPERPADWTDADVREVLLSIMRVFGRGRTGRRRWGRRVAAWAELDRDRRGRGGSRSRSRFRVARSSPGRSSCRPTS